MEPDKNLDDGIKYLHSVYGETALAKILKEIKEGYDVKNQVRIDNYIKTKVLNLVKDLKKLRK